MALHLEVGLEPVPGYTLVRLLGRGGFGEVWEARAPGGVRVALKFIRLGTKQAAPELRALEIIRDIRHPHLLDVQFAMQLEDCLAIAMPLCDESLLDRLESCRSRGLRGVPRKELLTYMDEVARAVDYLNEPRHPSGDGTLVGVQHRDIKPHNIFLVGGSARLADFGLAKVLGSRQASHTGSMTAHYAAPEVHHGKVTRWTDQYSLAVTYYELRTGLLPFAGDSMIQIVYAHDQLPPDVSGLPGAEAAVVARALSKDPEARWPTCRSFVVGLKKAVLSESGGASASATPVGVVASTDRPTAPSTRIEVTQRSSSRLRAAAEAPARPDKEELPPSPRGGGLRRAALAVLGVVLVGVVVSAVVIVGFRRNVLPEEPIVNTLGMKLAPIPAGEFAMGSGDEDKDAFPDEKPRHRVRITRPFFLGATEVTQGQYQAVTGENPSAFTGADDLPVENVSWYEAVTFCNLLSKKEGLAPYYQSGEVSNPGGEGYRLPTEAEWEYACRGGAGGTEVYSFGDDPSKLGQYAWFDGNSEKTHPVGEKPPNGFGLYDMHGNVWEWCWDGYDDRYYRRSPDADPSGPLQITNRVDRGGGWSRNPRFMRSAIRDGNAPGYRRDNVGFRVARSGRDG